MHTSIPAFARWVAAPLFSPCWIRGCASILTLLNPWLNLCFHLVESVAAPLFPPFTFLNPLLHLYYQLVESMAAPLFSAWWIHGCTSILTLLNQWLHLYSHLVEYMAAPLFSLLTNEWLQQCHVLFRSTVLAPSLQLFTIVTHVSYRYRLSCTKEAPTNRLVPSSSVLYLCFSKKVLTEWKKQDRIHFLMKMHFCHFCDKNSSEYFFDMVMVDRVLWRMQMHV